MTQNLTEERIITTEPSESLKILKTSDFDFELPEHLIAQYPLPERTKSRLLVLHKNLNKNLNKNNLEQNNLEHRQFENLIDYLNPGDLLVFNNSKVMKARLFGEKLTGAKIELLVERVFNPREFLSHIKANKALKPGTPIRLTEKTIAYVQSQQDGLFMLSLEGPETLWEIMDNVGHIPLPPYIQREDQASDMDRYQTVYAKHLGSVAAPTAGLHFDEVLLNKIKEKNIGFAEITLHVGAGTFKPVKTENLAEHKMHSETIEVSQDTCQKIKDTYEKGGKIIAIGTTTVRALESAAKVTQAHNPSELKPYFGETSIFISPPYSFKIIDAMVTNFHLPKSTLVMLVSAFSSREKILEAYQAAVDHEYRFFSYGDAMLII